MDIKLKEFERSDIDNTLSIFKELYPRKKNIKEFILWKYFNHPFSENIKSHLALDGNQIIGFRGWFPSSYIMDSKELYLPFASDAYVSPDHRRMGVFSQLMNFSLSSNKTNGIDFFGSLSISLATSNFYLKNNGKLYGSKFKTKSGEIPAISSQRFFLPKFISINQNDFLNDEVLNKFNSYNKYEISTSPKPSEMSKLYNITSLKKFSLKKNASFYDWRYKASSRYLFFYCRNEQDLLSFLVISQNKKYVSQIIDFNYSNIIAFNSLLKFANKFLKDRILTIWGYSKNKSFIENIESLGFMPIARLHSFYSKFTNHAYTSPVIMSYDVSGKNKLLFEGYDLSRLENWDFNQIDNDTA